MPTERGGDATHRLAQAQQVGDLELLAGIQVAASRFLLGDESWNLEVVGLAKLGPEEGCLPNSLQASALLRPSRISCYYFSVRPLNRS